MEAMDDKRTTELALARAARQAIRDHGWVQKDFGNDLRGYCALGAIQTGADEVLGLHASGVMETCLRCGSSDIPPARAVTTKLKELLDGRVVSEWNDEVGRTKEEVLAKFDELVLQFEETHV